MAKRRNLNDRQQKFLEVLFAEAKGDVKLAKELAGYASTTSTASVVRSMEEEVLEQTRKFFSMIAPQAAYSMKSILDKPTTLGGKEAMTAARDLLDRAGLTKTEKVQVTGGGGLFVLPAKDVQKDED